MKAQTPGSQLLQVKWSVDEGKYGNLRVLADLSSHLSWVVAVLEPQQYEHEENPAGAQRAVANLIAAAPDLLKACKVANDLLSDIGDASNPRETRAVAALRAAIAKVEGA